MSITYVNIGTSCGTYATDGPTIPSTITGLYLRNSTSSIYNITVSSNKYTETPFYSFTTYDTNNSDYVFQYSTTQTLLTDTVNGGPSKRYLEPNGTSSSTTTYKNTNYIVTPNSLVDSAAYSSTVTYDGKSLSVNKTAPTPNEMLVNNHSFISSITGTSLTSGLSLGYSTTNSITSSKSITSSNFYYLRKLTTAPSSSAQLLYEETYLTINPISTTGSDVTEATFNDANIGKAGVVASQFTATNGTYYNQCLFQLLKVTSGTTTKLKLQLLSSRTAAQPVSLTIDENALGVDDVIDVIYNSTHTPKLYVKKGTSYYAFQSSSIVPSDETLSSLDIMIKYMGAANPNFLLWNDNTSSAAFVTNVDYWSSGVSPSNLARRSIFKWIDLTPLSTSSPVYGSREDIYHWAVTNSTGLTYYVTPNASNNGFTLTTSQPSKNTGWAFYSDKSGATTTPISLISTEYLNIVYGTATPSGYSISNEVTASGGLTSVAAEAQPSSANKVFKCVLCTSRGSDNLCAA